EWMQAVFGEGSPGSKRVVGYQVIGESFTFDDDLLTLVFVEPTDPHEHDDTQQPTVEQDVPNLAGVAAFGADGPLAQFCPVTGFFEDPFGIDKRLVRGGPVGL